MMNPTSQVTMRVGTNIDNGIFDKHLIAPATTVDEEILDKHHRQWCGRQSLAPASGIIHPEYDTLNAESWEYRRPFSLVYTTNQGHGACDGQG